MNDTCGLSICAVVLLEIIILVLALLKLCGLFPFSWLWVFAPAIVPYIFVSIELLLFILKDRHQDQKMEEKHL